MFGTMQGAVGPGCRPRWIRGGGGGREARFGRAREKVPELGEAFASFAAACEVADVKGGFEAGGPPDLLVGEDTRSEELAGGSWKDTSSWS